MRRLTRFEYANIIRDTFGLTEQVEHRLPRDEVALGFDNNADTLTVSELHVEAYQQLAEELGRRRQ